MNSENQEEENNNKNETQSSPETENEGKVMENQIQEQVNTEQAFKIDQVIIQPIKVDQHSQNQQLHEKKEERPSVNETTNLSSSLQSIEENKSELEKKQEFTSRHSEPPQITTQHEEVKAVQKSNSLDSENDKENSRIRSNTNPPPSTTPQSNSTNLKDSIDPTPTIRQISAAAYNEIYLQRKKDSFNIILKWDDRRTHFLNFHRVICDKFLSKLERRVKLIEDGLITVIKFFKEKREQESVYFKHTVKIKVNSAFKDVSEQTSEKSQTANNCSWYPALSSALQQTDDMNEAFGKNVSQFVQFIEKSIIADLLVTEQADFEKKSQNLIQALQKERSRLIRATSSAADKSAKYSKNYHEMIAAIAKPKTKRKDKDLFSSEMKFRRSVEEQHICSKKLGSEIFISWYQLKGFELHLMQTVQKAFSMYIEKFIQTYNHYPQTDAALKSFTSFNPEQEIEDIYVVNKFLDTEDMTNVRQTLVASISKEENQKAASIEQGKTLSVEELRQFLEEFTVLENSSGPHRLVQQKFQVFRDIGTVGAQWEVCEIIATVDNYLLFNDQPDENLIKKPERQFKIDYLTIKERDEKKQQNQLELIEQKPGLIFESTNKQVIKFVKEDDKQEFQFFLSRFVSGPAVPKLSVAAGLPQNKVEEKAVEEGGSHNQVPVISND